MRQKTVRGETVETAELERREIVSRKDSEAQGARAVAKYVMQVKGDEEADETSKQSKSVRHARPGRRCSGRLVSLER